MRARYLFLAVFLVATAAAALAKGEPLDLLGRLPVLSQGRVMPLDSLARLAVWQIAQSRNAAGLPPLRWLAGLLFDPGATSDDRVFFIGQPDTPAALGLGTRGRGRYSLHQLQPGLDRLYDLTDAIARRGDGARDAVEADLLHLRRAVDLYSNLRGAFDFARPDPRVNWTPLLSGPPSDCRAWDPTPCSRCSMVSSVARRRRGTLAPPARSFDGGRKAGRTPS